MFLTEVNASVEVNDNKAWSQDFIDKNKKKMYHQKMQILIYSYII